jgi:S-DNA-T family DNA segregation ATPase FtsK/SpoIIIE
MPKKKKNSRTKKQLDDDSKTNFGVLSLAVVMILIGLVLLLGGFHAGGPAPIGLYRALYFLFGLATFLIPISLVYSGVYLLVKTEHKLPKSKIAGLLAVIILFSSFIYTVLVQKSPSGNWLDNKQGGHIGRAIGGLILSAFDKVPASVVLIVLTLLIAFYAFSIPPVVIVKLIKLFKVDKEDQEPELEALKAKAGNDSFQLNEGVPVVHHDNSLVHEPTRLTSLKNTAQKLTNNESHEALTTTTDSSWQFPNTQLLNQKQDKADAGDVNTNAKLIHDTFANFNIAVEMEGANIGPRVTQYTLKPPTGVKLTKITALENNLALDLAAHAIRIEAPIPGKRAVGIEVPNVKPATVRVSSIINADSWQSSKSNLTLVIGKDIAGHPVVTDLGRMPHLLVAGQTGSGKSVMINTILTSMLFRNSPSDLKLILVDPKQVELKPYDEIPHLLTPVITEPEKCISALKWAVAEMERRYKALAEVNKRDIVEYNNLKKEEGMPYIVIVIDELADLMMMAARDVEALIVRIAQKARAVGIHLVLATQRPSVDVITGLIKANIPARIAFKTTSQVDSRTIIDQVGAEKLLGQGDMLMTLADSPKPRRIQGAFIDGDETNKIIDFLRMQRPPQYDDEVVSQPVQLNGKGGIVADFGSQEGSDDMMLKDAIQVVVDNRKASTSLLQRRLRIGYGRAARLIETMEEQGIVGPADGSRPREVLVNSINDVYGSAQSDNIDNNESSYDALDG